METVVGDLMATELRLGLPGTVDEMKAAAPSTPRGKKRTTTDAVEDAAAGTVHLDLGFMVFNRVRAHMHAVRWIIVAASFYSELNKELPRRPWP